MAVEEPAGLVIWCTESRMIICTLHTDQYLENGLQSGYLLIQTCSILSCDFRA